MFNKRANTKIDPDSLRLFVDKNPFGIIALSETWLNSSITNNEIRLHNYLLLVKIAKINLVEEQPYTSEKA